MTKCHNSFISPRNETPPQTKINKWIHNFYISVFSHIYFQFYLGNAKRNQEEMATFLLNPSAFHVEIAYFCDWVVDIHGRNGEFAWLWELIETMHARHALLHDALHRLEHGRVLLQHPVCGIPAIVKNLQEKQCHRQESTRKTVPLSRISEKNSAIVKNLQEKQCHHQESTRKTVPPSRIYKKNSATIKNLQ